MTTHRETKADPSPLLVTQEVGQVAKNSDLPPYDPFRSFSVKLVEIGAEPDIDDEFNVIEAHCPACKSRKPILRVERNGSGKLLFCKSGCDTEDILNAVVEMSRKGQSLLKVQKIKVFSAFDLHNEDIQPLRWVVPHLIPEGLTIFAGRPKMGKSTLVLNLADAVTSGGKALGTIKVDPADVLYLALEDGKRRLKDRLMAIRDGKPPSPRLSFAEAGTFPRLDGGGADMLRYYLEDHPNCRLVVIDTWAKISPNRKNNSTLYDSDAQAWSILFDMAHKHRTAIICVHHTRKGLSVDGDWLDEISGTTGITGVVDTAMLLKRGRGETTAVLSVGGRDVDEKEYALEGDPRRLTWTIMGDAAHVQMSAARKEILEHLERVPGQYPKEIAAAIGKKDNTVSQTLGRMLKDGFVRVDAVNRYHSTHTTHTSQSSNESHMSHGSQESHRP